VWPNYTDTLRQTVLDKMAAAGMKWVRIDVSWARIEDTGKGARNAFQVAILDKCVDMSRQRGLEVMLVQTSTPSWAGGSAGPRNPADFADFMRWMTDRYRGRVKAYQIYNEQNNGGWGGTLASYVATLKAAYQGIKAVDPSAIVVTGGAVYADYDWVNAFYAAGAKGYFDVFGSHPYQSKADEPPEYIREVSKWWFANLYKVHEVMAANGDGHKPIWITEFGYSAHSNATIPLDSVWAFGVTEAQQADYSVRAFKYARANWPWLGVFFYYKEISWPLGSLSPSWFDLHTQNYALLRSNGTERPVYGALKTYFTGS
jgi:hypothetical protein